MSRKTLIIATRNAHKAREIAAILPQYYDVKTLADYPEAPEVEECGLTFAENARLKACGVSAVLPGLVLADDSGLCVDALRGAPGVHSARYAGEHGDDEANNRKLLTELKSRSGKAPFSAHFVCAMSLAQNGREIAAFSGVVEGQITLTPAGSGGFGYDPLFIPNGFEHTFAQLPAKIKNGISHRSRALAQLANILR